LKPVSFSVLTPDETGAKSNSWYKLGMTGGLLYNYNFLGLMFVISTVLLIISMFRMQEGETNRFKNKKSLRDWIKFAEFKVLIQKYETIIWKLFFVFFSLSTIPLIFALPSKFMTQGLSFEPMTTFEVMNCKFSYLFFVLFMFGLFYTSIPRLFYNNVKNFLKKHIVK